MALKFLTDPKMNILKQFLKKIAQTSENFGIQKCGEVDNKISRTI